MAVRTLTSYNGPEAPEAEGEFKGAVVLEGAALKDVTERISSDDRMVLQRAVAQLQHANAAFDFVREHLSLKYGLTQRDNIRVDGTILREATEARTASPV